MRCNMKMRALNSHATSFLQGNQSRLTGLGVVKGKEKPMKILSLAICVVSAGVLSGCVDDRGYRGGGYYSSSVHSRGYDDNRYFRDRDFRRDRDRDWRDNRGGYRGGDRKIVYGVIRR